MVITAMVVMVVVPPRGHHGSLLIVIPPPLPLPLMPLQISPTLFWTAGPTQVFRLWDDGDNGGTSAVQMYGILFTFIGGGDAMPP